MMTSSNGDIYRVTGPVKGEFTRHHWIPLTKGQWHGALSFSLSEPERTVEQEIKMPVSWDAMVLIMTSL